MRIISCNVHQKVQTLTLIVSFRVFYILREKITLKYMKMSSPASYPYIQHRKWMVKRVWRPLVVRYQYRTRLVTHTKKEI